MAKITLSNIYHYIIGNIRYSLYYSSLKNLIPSYIREQIDFRISVMNKECYNTGSCIKCGCKTTALQMASKPCEGDCYPPLLSKSRWDTFKRIGYIYIMSNGILWELVKRRNHIFIKKDSETVNIGVCSK